MVKNRKVKNKKRSKSMPYKFAVPVRMDAGFVVFCSLCMLCGLVGCVWLFYVMVKAIFFLFFTQEGHLHLVDELDLMGPLFFIFSCIIRPVFTLIPVALLFLCGYILKTLLYNYFYVSHYHMIFSNRGIYVANNFTSWHQLVWFGGKKTFLGRGIKLCWALKTSRNGDLDIEVPAICPISEQFFHAICKKINESFPEETKHLDSMSWKTNVEELAGRKVWRSLIPWNKKPSAPDCEIFSLSLANECPPTNQDETEINRE